MAGSNVELIKEKLDIVEFLKGYLTLQPAGKNFKALCPFHHEKTPSFMISPDRQSWHCFGCALGGDAFAFLMRYENVEFGDALKMLAEKAGIELKYANSPDYKYSGLLYEINNEAKNFFRKELERSDAAKKYLAERGLSKETIEEFEIGWAPDQSDALNLYLIERNFYPDDIVRAGMAFKSERGLQLDRFRGRIMFPIHNHLGKVVGFTGRVLPQFDDGKMGNPSTGSGLAFAKYVNSPETPIFNKSKLLYGFWRSKNSIRETGSVFLVEGQMDFLMSYQVGVKNGVASSGTALTEDHLRTLRRLTDQMVLSFDNDEAGLAAGERAIDLAEKNDFNVRVVALGSAKDPAEAIQNNLAAFKKAFAEARPAPEFYFERYLKDFTNLPPHELHRQTGFTRNLRVVLGKIKNITSPVMQGAWIKEFADRLGIDERTLHEETDKLTAIVSPSVISREAAKETENEEKRVFSRAELLCQFLLASCIARNDFSIIEDSVPYLMEEYREILALLRKGIQSSEDKEVDGLMNLILLRAGEVKDDEIADVKKFLAEEHAKGKRQELTAAVKKAEAQGDEASILLALQEFNKQS
ncbi:MAG: DNA primase [Patescibacteria group bacterium]